MVVFHNWRTSYPQVALFIQFPIYSPTFWSFEATWAFLPYAELLSRLVDAGLILHIFCNYVLQRIRPPLAYIAPVKRYTLKQGNKDGRHGKMCLSLFTTWSSLGSGKLKAPRICLYLHIFYTQQLLQRVQSTSVILASCFGLMKFPLHQLG